MTQALQISAQRWEDAADAHQSRGQGDEAERCMARAADTWKAIEAGQKKIAIAAESARNRERKQRKENQSDPLLHCQLTENQWRGALAFRDMVKTAGQHLGSVSNMDRIGGGANDNTERCVERAAMAEHARKLCIAAVSAPDLRTAAQAVVLGVSMRKALDGSPRARNSVNTEALKTSVRELLDEAGRVWL